jgi:hypothetical protein
MQADPGFCDPRPPADAPTAEGDYYLKDISPCNQSPCGLIGGLDVACTRGVHTIFADGGGEFATIQGAVDSIPEYDIVELASGTYTGIGNREVDYRGRSVIVRGESAVSSAIDCEGQGRAFHFHSGEDSTSILQNLSIMNAHASTGGAVLCEGSSPTIEGCAFHHSLADETGGALSLSHASPSIQHCTFVANSALSGAAIHCGDSSSPKISNVIIALNVAGETVTCDSTSAVVLACSNVYGNADGDWVGVIAGQDTVNGNFSADPIFCDPENMVYAFDSSSPCANHPGCGQVGAVGVGCYLYRAWRVPGDAPTIAAAIDSASVGDTVVVACGTYYEHDLVMKSGVIVRSETGSADCVTIDAGQQGRIFYCNSVDSTAVVQGLTITGGQVGGVAWPANGGGAIYCEDASPLVIDCVLDANSAVYGGAVAANSASPRLIGCTVSHNAASNDGGGIYGLRSTIRVERSIIAFSLAGEALCCGYQSQADVTCSDVFGNAGGDWVGCLAGKDGSDGNFSSDPMFCEPFTGHVDAASECASENSPPGCGLIGALGVGCGQTDIADGRPEIPTTLTLGPAIPNPFNPVTEIGYGIPAGTVPSRVTMKIYDATGRRVRTLVDSNLGPGVYCVVWDGTDHKGVPVASGVYFYRLVWEGKSMTRRMVLLK